MQLDRDTFVSAVQRDSASVEHVLRKADLDAPVAACPGWDLARLGGHLGQVHRWTVACLSATHEPRMERRPPRDELADWFAAGAARLVAELASVDLHQRCWTFSQDDRTAAFWVRRQAHETAVHRWDAETAATGHPDLIDARLAADGVHEVATFFYPRQVALGRRGALGCAMRLRPTDAGAAVVLGEGKPVVEVAGPAELLLLALWHRRVPESLLDAGSLKAVGDEAAARRMLAEQLTS